MDEEMVIFVPAVGAQTTVGNETSAVDEEAVIPGPENGNLLNDTDFKTAQMAFLSFPVEAGVVLILLCVIGGLCNTLTILVLWRRDTPGTRLLLYLSCVDMFFIILVFVQGILRLDLLHGTNVHLNSVTPFLYPLLRTTYTLSAYITTLVAVQRTLVLRIALKFIHLTRDSVFKRCFLGVVLFAAVVNIPEWINSRPELYWNSGVNVTLVRSPMERAPFYELYQILKLPVDTLFPMVITLACGVVMVISKIRYETRPGDEQRQHGRKQLTNIVVAITTKSVILGMAQTCMYAVLKLNKSLSPVTIIKLNIALTVFTFTQSSINFFIYCLFAPSFRKSLTAIFRKKCQP